MSGFTLIPAIDVREGRVVRLRQGDYTQETRYADDPLAIAQRYAEAGARWLHLVDLDAAREGGYTLAPLLASIKATTSLRVQTGGGVRSANDVNRILDVGADRVVVGSLAVRNPDTVLRCLQACGAERMTVALDARRIGGHWQLPIAGWTRQSGMLLTDMVEIYAIAGLRHALCTDIDRDGMLAGPNIGLYREILAQAPQLQLQASGGVRGIADIVASREAGCAGVVLGKALLDGCFDLSEALTEQRTREIQATEARAC
jgi:phosphoribosylformimino-5-aminoimidazole carboxamide ribotide isomerase